MLVVAGDLIPRMTRGVKWLLERVPDRPVLYIAGNHEPYGEDIALDLDKARAAAAGSNVHVLNDQTFSYGGFFFHGCTLWTDFDLFKNCDRAMAVAAETMNDYRKIRTSRYELRLRPTHTAVRHMHSRDFLARELRQPGRHVVISHHGPLPSTLRRGTENDIISAAYASDLSALIAEGKPELWIYGHTHETKDFFEGSTRVITNGKGYGPWLPRDKTSDNPRFNPTLTIEI